MICQCHERYSKVQKIAAAFCLSIDSIWFKTNSISIFLLFFTPIDLMHNDKHTDISDFLGHTLIQSKQLLHFINQQVFQGDYIWIEPVSRREFDVAIGAKVVTAEGRRIQVVDDDEEEQWLTPERRIKAMHPTSIQGVEDMISLGDLHEAGILRNLLIRYNDNLIYVRTTP